MYVLIIYAFLVSNPAVKGEPPTIAAMTTAEFSSLEACKQASDDSFEAIKQFSAGADSSYARCYPK